MFITTVGGGMLASAVVGGLMGGGESQQSQSTQKTIDPRMSEAIYGTGGIAPSARNWYDTNRSGLNSQMLTGMDDQWQQLGASRQGYNQMQGLGMGLMGGSVAGNPFGSTTTGLMARPAQQQPAYQPAQQPAYQPAQAAQQPTNPYQPTGGMFSTQHGLDQQVIAAQAQPAPQPDFAQQMQDQQAQWDLLNFRGRQFDGAN